MLEWNVLIVVILNWQIIMGVFDESIEEVC